MSLEQAIAENTAAIRELIQTVKALATTSVMLKETPPDLAEELSKPAAMSIVTLGEPATKVIPDVPVIAADPPPVDLDFQKDIIPLLMQLAKKPATGHTELQELLAEFGCKGKRVPDLKPLGRNAEIAASARRRLGEEA